MKKQTKILAWNRRSFLVATCGATCGLMLPSCAAPRSQTGTPRAGWPKLPPLKIYVVYLGTGGAWPKPEFDAPREIKEKFAPYLTQVRHRLGDVEFVGGDLIPNQAQAAAAIVQKFTGEACDAILVIHLSFGDAEPFKIFAQSGKPVAIYSQPFSGHDWMYVPRLQKQGLRLIMAASRDLGEIDRMVALLRVPARMKQSKTAC